VKRSIGGGEFYSKKRKRLLMFLWSFSWPVERKIYKRSMENLNYLKVMCRVFKIIVMTPMGKSIN
jgi:hypothetical protein